MKTVKITDLSKVELNVPFVHFHKTEAGDKKYFLVEFLLNLPLGAKISKPEKSLDDANKTISLNFELSLPKGKSTDSYELVHFPQTKVENVYNSENAILCVRIHQKATAIATPANGIKLMAAAKNEDIDNDAAVRYKDAPRK